MQDRIVIDGKIPQYKGNFHMHTQRSWDCEVPPAVALQEYRDKGYDFCAVTDHEVYWDSAEQDSADFITLPGMESAFLADGPRHVYRAAYQSPLGCDGRSQRLLSR